MLTFVPHKIKEDYKKVEFYRVNKELCNNEIYKDLSPIAILLYSLLCDRLSLTYTNELTNNIPKGKKHYYDEGQNTLYSMIYGKKQYSSSADKWINDISNIITKSYNYILND